MYLMAKKLFIKLSLIFAAAIAFGEVQHDLDYIRLKDFRDHQKRKKFADKERSEGETKDLQAKEDLEKQRFSGLADHLKSKKNKIELDEKSPQFKEWLNLHKQQIAQADINRKEFIKNRRVFDRNAYSELPTEMEEYGLKYETPRYDYKKRASYGARSKWSGGDKFGGGSSSSGGSGGFDSGSPFPPPPDYNDFPPFPEEGNYLPPPPQYPAYPSDYGGEDYLPPPPPPPPLPSGDPSAIYDAVPYQAPPYQAPPL